MTFLTTKPPFFRHDARRHKTDKRVPRCCVPYVACKPTGSNTAMNKLLLRGGLSRATWYSGSPFLRTSVRFQSSEEVAQDPLAEDDDVEGGNATNTLASNGQPLRQARWSSDFREKGVAPSPGQRWYNEATQPQNGLNGEHHFSRSGRVAAAPAAAAATAAAAASAAVSAPAGAPRGSPSSADCSPLSRSNGKVAPASCRGEGGRQIVDVNGAGKPTLPVSRHVSSRLSNRGQNGKNSSSEGQARNPWDILLNLKGGGAGGNGAAQLRKPRAVDEVNAGAPAAGRSDPLRPYPVPNGASILKVCTGVWYVFVSGTSGAVLRPFLIQLTRSLVFKPSTTDEQTRLNM